MAPSSWPGGTHLPAPQMGKAPTHCSAGCFDREGRERGAWRPESSASGHQGLPDSRLPSRQEGWSLVPFCPAQLLGHPQSRLYPFWALVGDSIEEALSVCCPRGRELQRRVMLKIWASLSPAIPFNVPLHSKDCTPDTSTELPCTICARAHTFTSDKRHVLKLSSVYTRSSPVTPLLSHSQCTESLLYTLPKYSSNNPEGRYKITPII